MSSCTIVHRFAVMMAGGTLAIAIAIGGCSSLLDAPADGGSAAAAACDEVKQKAVAALRTVDDSCTTRADCMLVGGPGTCDCARAVFGCGARVNRSAYRGSAAQALIDQLEASLCDFGMTCDCDPDGVLCVDGRCVWWNYGSGRCMLPAAPDAGSDAGAPDAGCTQAWAATKTEVEALDRTCNTNADCMLVGGPGTCNCGPSLFGCGLPANRAAYEASATENAVEELEASACDFGKMCDCNPEGVVCADGGCVFFNHGGGLCGIDLPDAGQP